MYQLGLGSDPVMVVGKSFPAVAFSMRVSPSGEFRHPTVQRRPPGTHVLFRLNSGRLAGPPRTAPVLGGTRPTYGPADLELDLGLCEQSALEQLRVGRAIELLHRHD